MMPGSMFRAEASKVRLRLSHEGDAFTAEGRRAQ
jgi:hypothetical protein